MQQRRRRDQPQDIAFTSRKGQVQGWGCVGDLSAMETSAPTATEKKECKASGLDGSSFSELPKKPSPTTLTRGSCTPQCSELKRYGYSHK
ncbi:hypothetical protein PAMP_004190 [Pampus punctatissimus]